MLFRKGECRAIFQDMFVHYRVSCSVQQCRVGILLAALPTELMIFIQIFCTLGLLSNA